MKKILIFVGLISLYSFVYSCEVNNMHALGRDLISNGLVRVSGSRFVINQSKVQTLLNKASDEQKLLIMLTLASYPKNHNLTTSYE